MRVYNPEKERLQRRLNLEGYVKDTELENELKKYKNCLIEAFSFSIAHELAHLYRGASIGQAFQPNGNEHLADCNAYSHASSTFGTVSEKDVFFRIYENLSDIREFKYFKSSINQDDLKRRTEIIRGALGKNSKITCK